MPKRKGGSEDIDDIESALLSLTQKPDTSKTTVMIITQLLQLFQLLIKNIFNYSQIRNEN